MAIVTGGAETLGRAVCRALLAADWRVASVGDDATALGHLAAAVGSPERALAIQADVTVDGEARAFALSVDGVLSCDDWRNTR